MAKRPMALGRGLSALLEEVGESGRAEAAPGAAPTMLPISSILANPDQPRRAFDPEAMAELVESVRLRGLLQPILVRPLGDGTFQIIAGERRWRAAQAAQLHEVPVLVRSMSDSETYEIALVENVQRVDLNPLEEAIGYARLVRDFGHTHEGLASIVGRSRSHITNLLRLLDLPESVQSMVSAGQLTMGHARALIAADDPAALAGQVVAGGLSVRATEALAARPAAKAKSVRRAAAGAADPNIAALEAELSRAVGSRVALRPDSENSGSISIAYSTLEQLDEICARLAGGPAI